MILFIPDLNNLFFISIQNDWPEGHRLATTIQFRFPECPKVPLDALITRASSQGLQLLSDLLSWDPEKRPTAQQSQKYPYFQAVKKPSAAPNRIITNGQQIRQDTIQPKENGHKNNDFDVESVNSYKSNQQSLIVKPIERVYNNGRESKNSDLKNGGENLSVVNGMFGNFGLTQNGSLTETKNNKVKEPDPPPFHVNGSELKNNFEKINDVYVNRPLYKDNNVRIKNLSIFETNEFNHQNNGFYLHEPKVIINNNNNIFGNDLNDSKVYNAFSKQKYTNPVSVVGSRNQLDNLSNHSRGSSVVQQAKKTPVRKWDVSDSFEDDELAAILG